MKKLTPILLPAFLLAGSIFGSRAAQACKCIPPPPPAQALQSSDAVFSGKVIAVKPAKNSHYEVTLRVVKTWKGRPAKTVKVWTHQHSATCGYPFKAGESYLVYASRREPSGLSVNTCSRTRTLKEGQGDVKALNAYRGPKSPGKVTTGAKPSTADECCTD